MRRLHHGQSFIGYCRTPGHTVLLLLFLFLFASGSAFAATNPFADISGEQMWILDALASLDIRGVLSLDAARSWREQTPARYEVASSLARSLAVVDMTKTGRQDVALLKTLVAEFKDELEALGVKTDPLGKRVAMLERSAERISIPVGPSFDVAENRAAAESVNAFAFDLYRELVKNEKGNVFFSPQNISSAFAMLYAGASDETEREIRNVFHYGDDAHADMRFLQDILNGTSPDIAVVEAANAVWPAEDLTLHEAYTDLLRNYYDSEVVPLDYRGNPGGAKDAINQWASDKTHGRIPDLVDSLDPETRLALTSAIYFKSEWALEFPKEQTQEQPFSKIDGSEATVNLMNQRGNVFYYETDRLQAVWLPYKNNAYSMLVVLPQERGRIKNLEGALSVVAFEEIMKSLQATEVILFLPKFTFRTHYELADCLSTMGLKRSFSNGAQFSRLAGEPLKIDRVIHKTFIEVDEKKTEAAAVTLVGVRLGGALKLPEYKIFRADHPFLFFILENRTNTILFMGRYMGP